MKLILNVLKVKINTIFERKLVNIFLPISLTYILGTQKNCFIETVLLSMHNIFLFRLRNKKINLAFKGIILQHQSIYFHFALLVPFTHLQFLSHLHPYTIFLIYTSGRCLITYRHSIARAFPACIQKSRK